MSLIDMIYRDEIDKLIECFEDTEKKVKHLEQETFELAIPSVNQLRYVAYHILKASNPNNHDSVPSVKEEIKKALHHCQRAKFDALEIWITFLLEEVRIFQESYSPIKETQDVISNYLDCLSKVQDAANELQAITDEEKDREEYYRKIEPHHQELNKIVQKFRASKPLIATLVEENNTLKKQDTRRFITTTLLTVVGGLIAFALLASKIGLLDNKKEITSDTQPSNKVIENRMP